MNVLTFVNGIQQEGFLGQYPTSFELHPYYDGESITSFTIDFDDIDVNDAFMQHIMEHFPDCYICFGDEGLEVTHEPFIDYDDWDDDGIMG